MLGIFAAFLRLNTDENILRRAEVLRLDFAEVQLVQTIANIGNVGIALLGADLNDRAALEVDAEVQTLGTKPPTQASMIAPVIMKTTRRYRMKGMSRPSNMAVRTPLGRCFGRLRRTQ